MGMGFIAAYGRDQERAADRVALKRAAGLVVLFFDGISQVLVRRGVGETAKADFVALADVLGGAVPGAVRLYDRNMLLIEPAGDVRSEVEQVMAALKDWKELSS